MSKIEIAKMSDLNEVKQDISNVDGKVEGLHKVAKTGSYNDLGDRPVIPTKVEKTSELENDSGFITTENIPSPPTVPTKVSELTNDTGFITGVTGSEVSAVVEGLVATDVQGMISELKALIDALSAVE